MDFKKAEDKTYKNDRDHLIHHYSIALKEFKMLKMLEDADLLTPLAIKHINALKNYLNENLTKYMRYTWMVE